MKIITCTLGNAFYRCQGSNKDNFWILAAFLMNDVGWHGTPAYKKFISDSSRIETSGNHSLLEKEGDYVLIGCIFDPILFEPCIKILQKEFLSILDQWEQLIKLEPKEIIIFKRGESYILEGRNPIIEEEK